MGGLGLRNLMESFHLNLSIPSLNPQMPPLFLLKLFGSPLTTSRWWPFAGQLHFMRPSLWSLDNLKSHNLPLVISASFVGPVKNPVIISACVLLCSLTGPSSSPFFQCLGSFPIFRWPLMIGVWIPSIGHLYGNLYCWSLPDSSGMNAISKSLRIKLLPGPALLSASSRILCSGQCVDICSLTAEWINSMDIGLGFHNYCW